MKNLNLDKDEVIFLTEQEIIYRGSIGELTFNEIHLTNKRIICLGRRKKEDINFEIPLSKIKKYKNQPQVDIFEDDELGDCLRVQTEDGLELLLIEDYDDESLRSSIKNFFGSSRKNKNVRINAWIEKIKEFVSEDDVSNIAETNTSKVEEKPKQKNQ